MSFSITMVSLIATKNYRPKKIQYVLYHSYKKRVKFVAMVVCIL